MTEETGTPPGHPTATTPARRRDIVDVLLTDYRERQQEKRSLFQGYLSLAGLLMAGTGAAIAAAAQIGSSDLLGALPLVQLGLVAAILSVNSASNSNAAHLAVLEARINFHVDYEALSWELRYMKPTKAALRSIAPGSPFGLGYRILALVMILAVVAETGAGVVWFCHSLKYPIVIGLASFFYVALVLAVGLRLGSLILKLPDWTADLAREYAAEARDLSSWPPP